MKPDPRFPFAPGAVEHSARHDLLRDLAAAIALMVVSGLIGFAFGLLRGCPQ
ncbi:MAG: hypothetical protein V4858_08955 [Pseudomonadota bacterium]